MSRRKKIKHMSYTTLPENDTFCMRLQGRPGLFGYSHAGNKVGTRTLGTKWVRGCDGKIAYSNRLDAAREAILMEEQHGKRFSVYACSCCGQFHIGGER